MVEFSPRPDTVDTLDTVDTVLTNTPDLSSRSRAHLKVNAKGCGYSPSVNCSQWVEEFGEINKNFNCHHSKSRRKCSFSDTTASI